MASTQVNSPMDSTVKTKDVERKLQIYGIILALQAGKIPSNNQIDIALNSFLASKALVNPSPEISPLGHDLIDDVRNVMEQSKLLILTKNKGDLIQNFIWQSQCVQISKDSDLEAPVDKESAKQHGQKALDGFRTLGMLIISNGQFRKLLNDATIIFRDIAGDTAQKAVEMINPTDDQLSQLDKPADQNTWHDAPNLSANNIKQQIMSTFTKKAPLDHTDIQDAVGSAAHASHPEGDHDIVNSTGLRQDQRSSTPTVLNAQARVHNATTNLTDKLASNIPEESRDKARDRRERGKTYISGKISQERRDQTIFRLKKLVVECQGHHDYQEAITTLLDLAQNYTAHAKDLTQQGSSNVKGDHNNDELRQIEANLKILIERFANGTSMNELFRAINTIYVDADHDSELKNWFKHINFFVRKCFEKQGFIMDDAATEEWNAIYDSGNFLLRDRYRNHTDQVISELKFLADKFDEDPQNKSFAQSMSNLFNDLGNDENGKPTFKPELLKDLADVILPAAFENIRYVPVPRIEYSDPTVDFIIENLVLESDNFFPNIFEFTNDNYFKWGRKNVSNRSKHSASLHVAGIQMDLRDVAFYLKKKTFPNISDVGAVDIFLGGTGFSFTMKMSSTDHKDKQNFFKIDKVDVDIKNFRIKIKNSQHKLLFSIAKTFLLKAIRSALQKAIEKNITETALRLDSIMYRVKLEADQAAQGLKGDPGQAPNVYQRYFSVIKNQFFHGKRQFQSGASDTKVNMAVTKRDSIFPEIHLPGGISSKATEYKDLALKGGTWESSIFNLGSASLSEDVPTAPNISHVSRSVASDCDHGNIKSYQNSHDISHPMATSHPLNH
ncbi:BgTH12-07058 [Blumeria graminis f. sp. triticale]|uniref:BgTH12-07058 n=1 Tax=Blumeria graminis f. sp. triticale TaxID=1689686 RepID=A0A9W4D8J8_BLUGR|nr:BgTH12-07058 [Blumeria graminis f. sp. triticale]